MIDVYTPFAKYNRPDDPWGGVTSWRIDLITKRFAYWRIKTNNLLRVKFILLLYNY